MHTCLICEQMPAQDYPKWYPPTPSCAGAISLPHISAEVVGGTGGMAVLEAILTFKSDSDDQAARQLAVQHLLEPGALYPPQIYGPVIVQWVRLNGVDVTVPGPPHPPGQPDSLTTELWVLIGLGLFVAVTGKYGVQSLQYSVTIIIIVGHVQSPTLAREALLVETINPVN